MKHTKRLTIEEYGGAKQYNKKEDIQRLVNLESTNIWANLPTLEPNLPKYELADTKINEFKKTAGYYNFISNVLKELSP